MTSRRLVYPVSLTMVWVKTRSYAASHESSTIQSGMETVPSLALESTIIIYKAHIVFEQFIDHNQL